ncbi:hypothetical protein BD324DRAFT_652670 [Kockovaella imperatae]|uniref:DinB-like domain-containing protein n=1 Tax=Kockovaella imperatae TaxID=4999 RepID=A0A1Y1UA95_9TREE|nr:hypothetical protein BD324DRAFT_652670 [Kockovaella imperatae]ORX34948.1 hypothetical protein BD324DRAFT_652670 [Kockovaella imperatae]
MPTTLYDGTIRNIICSLKSLRNCLQIAQAKHSDPQSLVTARLISDMQPLSYQIYVATRTSDRLAAVMLNKDSLPNHENDLKSFDDFLQRIDQVLSNLEQVRPEEINALDGVPSVANMSRNERENHVPTSASNAFGAAMPHLHFHCDMAYAILRKEGVPLGKADYIQAFADGWDM